MSKAATTAPPPGTTRERGRPATGLRARRGDRLVIHGHRLGEHERDAEILEALGAGGGPPFRVRWSDTGAVTLLFPGSDASVERLARAGRAASRGR